MVSLVLVLLLELGWCDEIFTYRLPPYNAFNKNNNNNQSLDLFFGLFFGWVGVRHCLCFVFDSTDLTVNETATYFEEIANS